MTVPKPVVWLNTEIKSPPLSQTARVQAGFLLRQLQNGEKLQMPHFLPMPIIGRGCFELRISDNETNSIWRILGRIDNDAIVIVECFKKKQQKTPQEKIEIARRRLKLYDTMSL